MRKKTRKFWVFKMIGGRYYRPDDRGSHAQHMRPAELHDISTLHFEDAYQFENRPEPRGPSFIDWPLRDFMCFGGKWICYVEETTIYREGESH